MKPLKQQVKQFVVNSGVSSHDIPAIREMINNYEDSLIREGIATEAECARLSQDRLVKEIVKELRMFENYSRR